jgi:serine protease Do
VIGMPAKVMAADPFSDLAVLKIEADNLRPALFSKAKIRKGQFVIALGNPYAIARDGRASASWGIISNLNRVAPSENGRTDANKETLHQFGTLIQTDAKLNFGTSGGALVNLQGEMIGLTTSLAATSGFEQSAGYAIAVDAMFERVLESLKLGQLPEYGFLGIQPEDLRSVDKARGLTGARVSVVIPGLPGEAAGLRSDDVIFQVDETLIEDRNDLFRELSRSAAGDTVQLLVQRPRAGRKTPDILQLSALLSKKYVATSRPAYALHSQSAWRGMLVEYATAMPSELARGGFLSGRSGAPKVAILSVDPDTAAWKAGLRPGYGIVSVEDTPIESPEDFYRSVERYADSVSVAVIRDAQRIETISVGP